MLPSEYPKWRTVHSYFSKWSEPGPDGRSILKRALKKCGWRGPYQTGAQILNQLLDHRRTMDLQTVKNILAEGGYQGQSFSDAVKQLLGADVQIAKRSELHTFKVIPNAGLLNVLLHELKNASDYGKTVSRNSIPAHSSSISPSSPFLLKRSRTGSKSWQNHSVMTNS